MNCNFKPGDFVAPTYKTSLWSKGKVTKVTHHPGDYTKVDFDVVENPNGSSCGLTGAHDNASSLKLWEDPVPAIPPCKFKVGDYVYNNSMGGQTDPFYRGKVIRTEWDEGDRRWTVSYAREGHIGGEGGDNEVRISLYEPPIPAPVEGYWTWGSGYVEANRAGIIKMDKDHRDLSDKYTKLQLAHDLLNRELVELKSKIRAIVK